MTQRDIEAGLLSLGLPRGAVVLLHSSLASLGSVEGGADTVVNAFLGVLGEAGTLVVPAFGALGAVTDAVKARPTAVRSVHPRASVAAIGAQAEAICRDHWKAPLAHERDTPYMRIADAGGYICLLGVDQDRNTTLHTAEELLRLPYLKPTPAVTFDTPEGPVTKSWPYFPGPHRNFIGLDRLLRESGRMHVGRIGQAVVRLVKARDLLDLCVEAGKRDPAFALCDNPHCGDCVRQRADLRRTRLATESFRLAASARLAGRYVPEIIEQCGKAGIDRVELDEIQGRPVESYGPEQLAGFVAELREAGVAVTALRGRSVGKRADALVAAAVRSGVARVVLPLSHAGEPALAAAREHSIAVSFTNTIFDSEQASALLLQLRQKGFNPGFTFSAVHFARLGEHPFLGSYKQKLRRFVDQLDVEDGLGDGTPQPLAQGHAEIKEMISILRCAGFEGFLVLGAANRSAGTLADAVRRFTNLLDAM